MAKKVAVKSHENCFKIFRHASNFHECDHRLRSSVPVNRPDQFPLVAHPAMVLSAFASELYLKCLLCLETGKIPQTHNLKALYRDLLPDTKLRIESLWDAGEKQPNRQKMLAAIRNLPDGKNVSSDLQYALEKGADAFRELRYFYETERSIFLLTELPNHLRVVILEKMPWWGSARPTSPKFVVRQKVKREDD
jgi:hypothetical protein